MTDKANDTITPTEENNTHEGNSIKKESKKEKIRRFLLYLKRGKLLRFFVTILFPFIFPIIMTVVIETSNLSGEFIIQINNCNCPSTTDCICIQTGNYKLIEENETTLRFVLWAMLGLSCINAIMQFIEWIKEYQEISLRWRNASSKCAYNDMFEVHMSKNTQLRTAYHRGLTQGMLSFANVPYDVFSQIRRICWEFCNTIGQITNIEKKDLSAAFIYRYIYSGSNKEDQKWRWITGKGSKFKKDLNDYVEKENNIFHYLRISDNISTFFCNDKNSIAIDNSNANPKIYKMSYRDNSHGRKGSLFAAKVAFSSNVEICCEGILLIRSYGKNFMDDIKILSEDEVKHFISDEIFPCYRHLLQTELAMLYFCHQTEPLNDVEREALDKKELENIIKHNRFRCLETTTQKRWYKYDEHSEEIIDEE